MKKSMALLLTLALLISTIPTVLAAWDGGITENLITVGDMPLYEIYRDDGTKKPIVILLHGGGGRKEDKLPWARGMAEQGFYALAVDAAAHGDNKVHTLDAVACWATTVEQLDAVLDHYAAVPQADTEHFGMTGASMGGTVCYAYAAHGKYTPTIIAPSVGTPDYATMSDDVLYSRYSNTGDYSPGMSRNEIRAFAEKYAPVNFPERFLNVYIYAQNGTKDPTASPEGIRKLERALKDLGGTRFIFNIYEGVGHEGSPDYDDLPALRQILLGDTSHSVFSAAAAVSQPGLQNFTQRNTYAAGQFADVKAGDWFYEDVKSVYELDLMQGSNQRFSTDKDITIAETVTIAVRLHATYHGGAFQPENGDPWYQPYIDYAVENGIIQDTYGNYNRPATRLQFVTILSHALPESVFEQKNQIADNAIPDVRTTDAGAAEIYRFYRAGILTGNEKGSFAPGSSILRREAAAIIARMVKPELRKSVTLNGSTAAGTEQDAELQKALKLGIVPKQIQGNYGKQITHAEFAAMLANVIQAADPDALSRWNNVAAKALQTDSGMERDDGILALYEAACVLGMGDRGTAYWSQTDPYYKQNGFDSGYAPRDDIFSNCREIGLLEPEQGQPPVWDYLTCAMHYAMGVSSALDTDPYFAQRSASVKYSDALTGDEAVKAAYRLYLSYQAKWEGSFDNSDYATDWSDPTLSQAKSAIDAILNSPTTIKKGSTFVLGETYTGTAYYVSNSGKDSNDGKSPSSAWATLEKVKNAKLAHGDAVFFERGGTWYGALQMQTGVTYSAYGTGAKPILTGSPANVAQSAQWTYYGPTADGGKIWKYKDKVPDCGVILLNGEIVARKAYPAWDGKQYSNSSGEKFTIEDGLFADLMYFSDLDLSGRSLPVEVWQLGLTGPLYLRCDAGNPGDVFDTIELALVPEATSTAPKGWHAIDNLNFRCYSMSGMDCCNHDHIIYQNCETSWCGGGVKEYVMDRKPVVGLSGGGALMFGSDVTFRNNYIHDCENKGIAVVISGPHASHERVNVLAEGNVVERCGTSIRLWIGLLGPNDTWKYEDIVFRGNYFINSAYGWRIHNEMWIHHGAGTVGTCDEALFSEMSATGKVQLENNLFYRAAGCFFWINGADRSASPKKPTMSGNTYVQDKDHLMIILQRFDVKPGSRLAMVALDDPALMDRCLREYIGDKTGKIIVKQFT